MKLFLPSITYKHVLIALAIIFCQLNYCEAQQEVKVVLTGYSDDVIADPVLNTLPTAVTTAPIDLGAGNVFFATGYSNNATPISNGLPANGQFTSSAGHNFQLADYTGNNALRLAATQSGTLTFDIANQNAYDSLFIIIAGGSGAADLNYTVHFSDASTKTGAISVDDWFCNACTVYAIDNLNRVDRVTGDVNGSSMFSIKEYPILFTGGDESKQIVSIDFTVPAGEPGTSAIFGITAYMQGSLPVTLQYFNISAENGKALLQWKTSQEFNSSKFIIERASQSNPSNFVKVGGVDATSSSLGSQYSFTNDALVSGTYIYRLSQQDIDGHIKILGTKSITFANKAKWIIQDLGSQWQLISETPFIYRLLDLNGRVLKASNGSGNATITKPASKGVYLIQVQTNGEFSSQKLIN